MGIRFDASSRTAVLERLFRERGARRISAKIEGPAAEIAPEVAFVAFEGRLAEAAAGARAGLDALTVLALADGGEIEEEKVDPPGREPARHPDGMGLYRQAYANAVEIKTAIAPLGGLDTILIADLDSFVDRLRQFPDAVNVVLRSIDGQSTIASVLGRSPHQLRLSARILERLTQQEVLNPPTTVMPEPIDEVVAPVPGEMEVTADLQDWLADQEAPEPLTSPDAFRSAFTWQTPERMMTPKPGTKAPLPRDQSDRSSGSERSVAFEQRDEEEAFFRQAGVGRTNPVAWFALALVGAILGVIGSFVVRDDEPPSIDAGGPIELVAEVKTASTSTIATSSAALALGPDGRPPIAGPDAPEDVKRAERFLDAGRYSDARALLEQLRATRPNDSTVFILSGQVEVDVGRLVEGNGYADRALELDPKSYRAWVLAGSALQFRGRFAQAQSAYQRALALEPNHPMTLEIQSVLEQMEKSLNR